MQQAQQQRIQFSTQASRHEIGQINQYESSMQEGTLQALSSKLFHPVCLTSQQ
jgi:hypothetical protein